MAPSVDPVAQRADLERQLALLEPVLQHLRLAATGPGPLVSGEWRGPAADAAGRFLDELRTRLRATGDALDDHLRVVRLDIGARL